MAKKKKDGVPSHLKRGNRGPRKPRALSADQEQFCAKRARGLSVNPIMAELGMSFSTGWLWLRKPAINDRIEVLRKEFAAKNAADEYKEYRLNLEHLDIETTRVASMHKQHKFRGFSDKVAAITLGYRRLKAIEPNTRISASATAGAIAAAGGATFKERYKAQWLIEKEQRLSQQCEAEYKAALQPAPKQA